VTLGVGIVDYAPQPKLLQLMSRFHLGSGSSSRESAGVTVANALRVSQEVAGTGVAKSPGRDALDDSDWLGFDVEVVGDLPGAANLSNSSGASWEYQTAEEFARAIPDPELPADELACGDCPGIGTVVPTGRDSAALRGPSHWESSALVSSTGITPVVSW